MATDLTVFPKINNFSSGYWQIVGMYVRRNEGVDVPTLRDHMYGFIQDNYYYDERTPILFKQGGSGKHFRVRPDDDVRIDSIEMPSSMMDDSALDEQQTKRNFLMAKPRCAKMIAQMNGAGV